MALAYVLWRWNWPKLLFIESITLTIFCWRQKRNWKKRDNKSLFYFLFDKSVEFFVPLTIVLAFYAILALIVDGTGNETTLGRLEYLEGRLDSIHSYLGWLKLKPWIAVLIIVGVIILDVVLSLIFKSKELASSWYKHYGLWSKRVSTVVLLLCCFTFFGTAIGERRAHLRTRTDKIKEDYAKIQERAEATLSGSVQQKLFEKVRLVFPPEVRTQFDYPARTDERIQERIRDLDVSLKYAEKLGVKDENAAEVVRRHEAKTTLSAQVNQAPIRYSEVESWTSERITPPSDLTEASVQKSLSEIESTKSFRSRFVSLIKLDGTNQLLCQFPKSFTRVAKSAAFKTAMMKYPFLEPVVDVFVGTFDKAVEQKVRASVDKVAASLLRNPQAVDQVVVAEADKIVSSVEVKGLSPSDIEKAKRSEVNVDIEIKEIDLAVLTVKERMNSAAAEQALKPAPGQNNLTGTSLGIGLWKCSCYCGSRLMWGPVLCSSQAQCLALCPPLPCR